MTRDTALSFLFAAINAFVVFLTAAYILAGFSMDFGGNDIPKPIIFATGVLLSIGYTVLHADYLRGIDLTSRTNFWRRVFDAQMCFVLIVLLAFGRFGLASFVGPIGLALICASVLMGALTFGLFLVVRHTPANEQASDALSDEVHIHGTASNA